MFFVDIFKRIIFYLKEFFSKYKKFIFTVLGCIIFLLFCWLGWFEILHIKKETLSIKNTRTISAQKITAGLPAKLITFVNAKDIKGSKHFVKIPSNAKNVSVRKVTPAEIKAILKNQQKDLTSQQKQNILKLAKPVAKNNFSRNFLGALSDGFSFLLADGEQAVENVISAVAPDANTQLVDVSNPAPVETVPAETVPTTETAPATDTTLPSIDQAVVQQTPDITSTTSPSDQQVAQQNPIENQPDANQPPCQGDATDNCVAVEYDVPAPVITKTNTDTGQLVTVSADDSAAPLFDVVAATTIPKIFKVGEESKIKIKWKSNGNQNVTFSAQDTDGDGYLDYVEWTVPHLSEQTFEIIFISKAFQLDVNQNIIADIYDQVATQDQNYAQLADGQYVRSTFGETLDSTKDITVYAKPDDPNSPASIEVYPVYTDLDGNMTEGPKLDLVNDGQNPDFSNISADGKYRILLKNLQTPTDVFDLKIVGNIDIDYIVDPTPSTFTVLAAGDWETTGTWTCSGTCDHTYPVAGDTVVINAAYAVTISHNEAAASLSVSAGSLAISTYNLVVSGTSAVGTSAGTVTIGASSSTGWSTAGLTIGAGGTVTCSGASKITDSGDWDSSNATATFTRSSSTVSLTGTGIVKQGSGGIFSTVSMGASGKTTTFSSNISVNAGLTFGGGTVALGGNTLTLYFSNIDGNGTTFSGTTSAMFYFSGSTATYTVNNLNLGSSIQIRLAANGSTTSPIYNFTGTNACGTLNVSGGGNPTSTYYPTLKTGAGSSITATTFQVGIAANTGQGAFDGSSGGTINVNGDASFGTKVYPSAGSVNLGATTWNVTGSWTNSSASGNLIPGTSTVNFIGTASGKTITSGGSAFYNLIVNGSGGVWTLQDAAAVSGNLSVSAGTLAIGTNNLAVTGNSTIGTSAGTVTIGASSSTGWTTTDMTIGTGGAVTCSGNSIINVAGSWSAVASSFTQGTSTVTFSATTSGKTITSNSNAFYNVIWNGSGGAWTLQDNFIQSGSGVRTIAFTSGTLNFNGNTYTNGSTQTITVGGFTLNIGTGTFNVNYASLIIPTGSTVTVSTGTLWISDFTVSGSGTFTATGAATIKTYGSVVSITSSNWSAGQSTINQYTTGTLSSTQPLYNYTVNYLGTSTILITLQSDLTVLNNFTILYHAGSIQSFSAGSHILYVGGNWSNGDTFNSGTSTVNFTGTDQKIFGNNTFYNLTKDVSATAAHYLYFQQSNTQTIAASGTLTLKGGSGKVLTLRGCDSSGNLTSGDPKWGLSVNSSGTTLAIDYVDVKDSDASAAKAIAQTNSTDSGNNLNWLFNTAPNAPTLVSPANASTTSNAKPTLSANYSDPDTGDTGTTNYRISSSSLADCTNNVNVVASGASAETASNNQNTTWTPGSSIGSDATYYWCAQNNDGALTSAWTQMGNFILDTTAPTITINNPTTSPAQSKTITASVSDGTLTMSNTTGSTCDGTLSFSTYASQTFTSESDNGKKVCYKAQDTAGNIAYSMSNAIAGIDTTAPTTTDNSTTSWYGANQTITLSPTDAGSGIAHTYYCVDTNNSCTPTTEGTSVSVSCTLGSTCLQYVRYYSTDNAANSESVKTSNIVKIDKTPPSTIADAGNYTFGNWSGTSVTVALTCSDSSGSGCLATLYCTDTANTCTPSTPYTTAVTISTSGISYIRYLSTDSVSNAETAKSQTIKIDTTVPSVDAGSAQIKNAQFTQTGSATSQNFTIASYQWAKVSGPGTISFGTSTQPATTITAGTDGVYVISLTATDSAGHSNSASFTLTWDATPPSATNNVSSLWHNTNQTITFSCSDDTGVGCSKVYYTTDNSTPTTNSSYVDATSNWQFVYSSETTGATLKYISQDTLGNTSNVSTAVNQIKIDKTNPTTSDNFSNNNSWQSANQTIALTPADSASGIYWTKYCTDTDNTCDPASGTAYTTAVTISTEGTSYFRYASQDNAGNTQTTVSKIVKIDKTAPATIADAGNYTFGNWSGTSVTVALTCSDSSGSGCLATLYCADTFNTCTPSTPYTGSVTISTSGTSYIRYLSTDSVGNAETAKSQIIKVDTVAPTTSDNFTNNGIWQSTSQTITLTPADTTSGVAWTKYCTDATNTCDPASGTAYATAVTISTEGTSYFRYASQDNTGNTQTTVSKTVMINTTPPPPQVLINLVTATAVPDVSASVTITNEGVMPYEYHYEWCVVSDVNNDCGGGDDIYYSTAAKLITPGQDFNTILSATVPNTGTYYFKLVASYGLNLSSSSKVFTLGEETINNGNNNNGGSGGGAIISGKTGDINNDDKVDKYDFAIMIQDWGKTGSSQADLNHDGIVNKYDFAILMLNWNK